MKSGRPIPWGHSGQPPAHRADTLRDQVNRYFPSGSILAEPVSSPLESLEVSHALRDIISVVSVVTFVLVTGLGLGVSIFYFLFL